MKYWHSIFLLLGMVSCKNTVQNKLTFIENKSDWLDNKICYPIEFDSSLSITLIDNNKDGDYFDTDTNSCDLVTVKDIKFNQFKGIVFKPEIIFQYFENKYKISFDTANDSAFLTKINRNLLQADIIIFDTIQNFRLQLQDSLSSSYYLRDIIFNSSTKYIFLSFWAPYCQGCLEEMEFYYANKKQINENNLTVVNVTTSSNFESAKEYISKKNYSDKFYICSDKDMLDLNCQGFPNGVLLQNDFSYIQHFSYSSLNNLMSLIYEIDPELNRGG